jgi:hypothetical protein
VGLSNGKPVVGGVGCREVGDVRSEEGDGRQAIDFSFLLLLLLMLLFYHFLHGSMAMMVSLMYC